MMKIKGIYITSTGNELRIAMMESGKLAELLVEGLDKTKVVGDIYKGIVTQVNTGLNAAFVDIGLEKAAFLPLSEVKDKFVDFGDQPVDNHLKLEKGQEIFIQITKSPLGKKGPRATTYTSIPGRYIVFMPGRRIVGISRKIKNRDEKTRLRKIGNNLKTDKYGMIMRTEAKNQDADHLSEDFNHLKEIWIEIEKNSKTKPAPCLLHKEEEPVLKIIRDLFTSSIDEVVTDSKDVLKKITVYISRKKGLNNLKSKIKLYKDEIPIFEAFGIENEIAKLFTPVVKLQSGAYIIIEETEALISIDVNSGKASTNSSPEEMAFKTNQEAAREIARQLRLRNTGGLIVIDFIDMQQQDHKKTIKSILDRELSKDKANFITSQISDFGLLEMTRKRTGPSILKNLQKNCPLCNSSGYLFSDHFISSSLQRWLRNISEKIMSKTIQIRCSKELSLFLSAHLDRFFHKLSKSENISIEVVHDKNLFGDKIQVWCINDNQNITNWEGGILPKKDPAH